VAFDRCQAGKSSTPSPRLRSLLVTLDTQPNRSAMIERPSYKTTLFDRYGPDAAHMFRAMGLGAIAAGFSFLMFMTLAIKMLGLSGWLGLLFALCASTALGALSAVVAIMAAESTGKAITGVLASGHTTPYTEQYSYQQALVMQGRLEEALSTLEAIIGEPNSTTDVRIRAAELYAREAKKPERAAELFREVIRDPRCTVGEEVYSANRLVDLLNGPLGQPGRALVELGRLADRYPKSIIGERARQALRSLKAVAAERDQPVA
jgi:hypothetical protein